MTQKGLAPIYILVGVLILAVVAGGAYYFGKSSPTPVVYQTPQPTPSPTPDETASWKTYTNTKYGFSFQYPSELFISANSTSQYVDFLERQNENQSRKLGLEVTENPTNMDLRILAEKNRPVPDDRVNYTYETSIVNGYEALIETSELPCLGLCDEGPTTEKNYVVRIRDKKFVIGFLISTYSSGNYPSTADANWLNQILSTFKFTN